MLTNLELAELLARRAEISSYPFARALKRASRMALSWPVEAATVEDLQDLPAVGPTLTRLLREWLENPPESEEPPPLRSNFLTLAQARNILRGLDWQARGDLQMHTVWSDGSSEIEDMADEARRRGYSYIAITDHTKGLKIANGLDEERLHEQSLEIERLNRRYDDFRILRSAEVNLSLNGEIDIQPCELDLVLGCFHSKLRLVEDQTERYLKALRNPRIHILGHPRGRIYNFRIGLTCDWERVLAEAAALDKAVEIDCFPDRQDLDVATLHLARDAGVRISLGTDAHSARQLGFMDLGLAAAWKAGISRERILNFMPAEELLEWATGSRGRP